MIKKVAFVAHPTRDLERAMKFFGETLGLERTSLHGECWAEFQAADGTTVALDTFSPQHDPAATVYLALETDDIDAEIERLRAAGAEIFKDAWENKEADGKSVCKMAYIRDPDGNAIMLHEIAAHRA